MIDYNPASNYGNWAYQAHVGNDSTYRIFDIDKQTQMYNGNDYINKWLNKRKLCIWSKTYQAFVFRFPRLNKNLKELDKYLQTNFNEI